MSDHPDLDVAREEAAVWLTQLIREVAAKDRGQGLGDEAYVSKRYVSAQAEYTILCLQKIVGGWNI